MDLSGSSRTSGTWLICTAALAALWGLVLFVGGAVGPYAWWGLIITGLPAAIVAVICVVRVALSAVRRQRPRTRLLGTLLVSVFAAWPGAWLFGVGQIAYPTSVDSVKPAVHVRLPIDGPVLVGWGGDTLADNYHAWLPVERWAYDLLSPPALSGSDCLDDYGIFGMNVVAPADGQIVAVHDGEADNPPGTDYSRLSLGNYLFLRLDETSTYLVIGHLRAGSVRVKVGERVREGAILAQAGNYGASSEPHVHIHHQRQDPRRSLLLAEGLPLYFRGTDRPAMPRGGGDRFEAGVRVPNGALVHPLR